jgi:type IV pilus assembly protein PilA
VVEYWADRGRFPENNKEAGLDELHEFKGNIATVGKNGVITIEYNEKLATGAKVLLTPTAPADKNGYLKWDCTSYNIKAEWLPESCR